MSKDRQDYEKRAREKADYIERITRWLMPDRKDPEMAAQARERSTLDGVYTGKSAKIYRIMHLSWLRGVRKGATCAWEARQKVYLRGSQTTGRNLGQTTNLEQTREALEAILEAESPLEMLHIAEEALKATRRPDALPSDAEPTPRLQPWFEEVAKDAREKTKDRPASRRSADVNEAHRAVELARLKSEIATLELANKRLRFMVDNGLGEEDMVNDIRYPPRE